MASKKNTPSVRALQQQVKTKKYWTGTVQNGGEMPGPIVKIGTNPDGTPIYGPPVAPRSNG